MRDFATSLDCTTFAPQHLCSLEGFKCCSLWPIPEEVSVYSCWLGVWRGKWPMGCKRAFWLFFWRVIWLSLDSFWHRNSFLGTRDQDRWLRDVAVPFWTLSVKFLVAMFHSTLIQEGTLWGLFNLRNSSDINFPSSTFAVLFVLHFFASSLSFLSKN